MNGVAVLNTSSPNTTTVASGCRSGFASGNKCIASANAVGGNMCTYSVYPNCNCVSGVCTTFATQSWAIGVLCGISAIILVCIILGVYLVSKIKEAEARRSSSRQ